jgi:hypothetical protein
MVQLVSRDSLGDVARLSAVSLFRPEIPDESKRYTAGPVVQFDRAGDPPGVESAAYFLVKQASPFDTRKDDNQPPLQARFTDVRLGGRSAPAEEEQEDAYDTQYSH